MFRYNHFLRLCFTFIPSASLYAHLGEHIELPVDGTCPVEFNINHLQSQQTITNKLKFERRCLQFGRTKVQELVNQDGTVFALQWSGAFSIPMEPILGPIYLKLFEQLAQEQRPPQGRAPFLMSGHGLNIERSGQMRDLRGRAWIPDTLPEGFDWSLVPWDF